MPLVDRITVRPDRVTIAALARSSVVALGAQGSERPEAKLIVIASVWRMMISDRRRRHQALLAAQSAERLDP
jgi:hypothetical protein